MKNAPAKVTLLLAFSIGLLIVGYFQGYVHGVTGTLSTDVKGMHQDANRHAEVIEAKLANLRGNAKQHVGDLNITVNEKPFGMHLRRGSTIVEEVFPGFPAEKLGVRAGCDVKEIAGEPVKQGTWLQIFQKRATPFQMLFHCPPQADKGHGPMSGDPHNYRVLVVKRPFGMNVQVNTKGNSVPRVVEVLAGSPAEAAGVKSGYVLTAVQEQTVDAESWFHAWQKATLPCTLTFDTSMPIHDTNPHIGKSNDDGQSAANLPEEWHEDEAVPGFDDVTVSVKELPFGMHVDAPPGKLPIVKVVPPGTPAEAQGVKAGDVLLKVAGHRVDSSTWFAAFQHAVPPFGLRFRRPHLTDTKGGSVPLPVMPVYGELEVTVRERPFGMNVQKGGFTVKEAFPGFPAQKLGVRKGCEIRQIAGKNVSQGTWMEVFQKTKLPFQLKLFCRKSDKKKDQETPLSQDEHNFKVAVKKRPFGMNVQTHVNPRVAEVLPGYPAEAAGVKAGWVLKAINDQAVDADNWLDIWHHAPVGTVLTFDTNMPLNEGNPFMSGDDEEPDESPAKDDGAPDVREGYTDFRCPVQKLPFGFSITAPKGKRPTVNKVLKGSPAEAAGVKVGDVLIEIAGLPVDASSWFRSFQQAVAPFGIHFRRPEVKDGQPQS